MMKQRPPTTDLSGGKTSEDSFTPWRNSLVAEDTRDFVFGLFLSAVLGPLALGWGTPWTWLETVGSFPLPGKTIRGGKRNNLFTNRWHSHRLSPKARMGVDQPDGFFPRQRQLFPDLARSQLQPQYSGPGPSCFLQHQSHLLGPSYLLRRREALVAKLNPPG